MIDASSARPLVICSVLESSVEATTRRLDQVPRGCALVEIRGDRLRRADIVELVRRAGRSVAVTVRRACEGGGFEGTEGERRRTLLAALDAGARFVDVELRSEASDLAEGGYADRVILSHHGSACTPSELASVYGEMARTRAARLKIVPRAARVQDIGAVLAVLDTARRDGRALACFASGRAGAVTRLMAPSWGSWATYGAVATGAETAAGQFTARDLLDVFGVTAICTSTRRFALIGQRVFGSPSPAMHNAAYRSCGVDARYVPLELDHFEDCLPLLGRDGPLGIEALAVTMPFKQLAFERCRTSDAIARASEAVNTVLIARDGWVGHNTDGPAARALIADRVDVAGATVAIVGAGGTARAVAASLSADGARVTLFNRSLERAIESARGLGVEGRGLADLESREWDVLVQATPLGTRGERVVEEGGLRGRLVLDAVYGAETPLVRDARERGLHAIDGFDLLVAQAVRQFECMTGMRPDESVLRRAGNAWLASKACTDSA